MICVTWLLLIDVIYSRGVVVCPGSLACEKCLVDGSIYLSVKFEYVSFPIGLCGASALAGYMCILLILEAYVV